MNEKELVEQLNQLPKEIDATNNWQSVLAAIEAEPELVKTPSKTIGWKWPVSLVASLALVTLVSINMQSKVVESSLSVSQQKTLTSLQQANSQYYSAVGLKMQELGQPLPNGLGDTLKDIRSAQKSYMNTLAQSPAAMDTYLKLIESYKIERKLLKELIG